jgi:hypothetical protein
MKVESKMISRDLRDLRIDVRGIAKTQRVHGRELHHHTAILTAIATHLGIPLPESEPDDEAP